VADLFETTRWSLVLAAGRETSGSAEALEWLCATYWYPLYAYVRRQGRDVETAKDLTQSFFVSFLAGEALTRVDPGRGKFRAFLIASMKNFLSNERDREQAIKRQPGESLLRLGLDRGEERYLSEPATDETPEAFYESRWALSIFDRALQRLQQEQAAGDRGVHSRRLIAHLTGDDNPYQAIAAEIGMTEGAARVAVHRLRRRLGALLREEVAHTVADAKDLDDEIRHLLAVLGRGR
jgi:RNA polymerase sigma-70 factor (ECF subfamily)